MKIAAQRTNKLTSKKYGRSERAISKKSSSRHRWKTGKSIDSQLHKIESFSDLICSDEASKLVEYLIQWKEKAYNTLYREKQNESDLKKRKICFLFRKKWEQQTCKNLSDEIRNLNGVSK